MSFIFLRYEQSFVKAKAKLTPFDLQQWHRYLHNQLRVTLNSWSRDIALRAEAIVLLCILLIANRTPLL